MGAERLRDGGAPDPAGGPDGQAAPRQPAEADGFPHPDLGQQIIYRPGGGAEATFYAVVIVIVILAATGRL